MITVNNKKWNKLKDEEKISYCDGLLENAEKDRRKLTWDWYLDKQFIDGNHYTFYNAATNTIETPPRRRDSVRLVINKVNSSIRSIKNYISSFRPKWEVLPTNINEESIDNARKSGKLLDYLYDRLNIKRKIRLLVDFSLWTSVGLWEIGWDENERGGEGEVFVMNHDPFDVYFPFSAYLDGPIIHSPFVGKVLQRDVNVLKNDERFDEKARKKIKADGQVSLSEMKKRIRVKQGQKMDQKSENTALLREVLLWDASGNEEGGKIQRVTYVNDNLLRDEELKYEEYPVYIFQPEMSDTIYTTPWVRHMIPLNKAIDRLESQILEYTNKALRARIIAEKGHGVNLAASGRTSSSEMEVMEHNPGRKFEQFNMNPMPLTIHRQIDNMNQYFQEVSGAHEASLGSLPSGARSGKVLEGLQAADANNLSGITSSLELFLAVLGSRLLKIISDNYSNSRVIKLTQPEPNGQDVIQVTGQNAPEVEGATIIVDDNEVVVKIGSWLGFTREAQRETLFELADRNIIPREEVLRELEFANIASLSEKARAQGMEEYEAKADIAGRRGQQAQAMAGEQEMSAGDEDLADQENVAMMNGDMLPPTQGASMEHTMAHIDFMEAPEAQSSPEGLQIISEHANGELAQQQGGGDLNV